MDWHLTQVVLKLFQLYNNKQGNCRSYDNNEWAGGYQNYLKNVRA